MTEFSGRFTGKAADYAQFRERYDPALVLPFLAERCGLRPDWRVADIGAGTGMVGDMFRTNGNPLIAIEPNQEMFDACAALHAADDQFTVIQGSAENTGLGDASVEMIAIGRALHWFNVERALPEFRRILKPRGWIVILACGRSEFGREENLAYKELLQTMTERDLFRDPLLDVYRRLESLFPGGQFHHAEIAGEMQADWEGLRGLTLSLSHAPMPGSANFSVFESELRGYFDRFAKNGLITLTTCTWMNAGQFAN